MLYTTKLKALSGTGGVSIVLRATTLYCSVLICAFLLWGCHSTVHVSSIAKQPVEAFPKDVKFRIKEVDCDDFFKEVPPGTSEERLSMERDALQQSIRDTLLEEYPALFTNTADGVPLSLEVQRIERKGSPWWILGFMVHTFSYTILPSYPPAEYTLDVQVNCALGAWGKSTYASKNRQPFTYTTTCWSSTLSPLALNAPPAKQGAAREVKSGVTMLYALPGLIESEISRNLKSSNLFHKSVAHAVVKSLLEMPREQLMVDVALYRENFWQEHGNSQHQYAAAAPPSGQTPAHASNQEGIPPAGNGQDNAFLNGRRVALVIGINRYNHYPVLANAVNDAQAVAQALRRYYSFDAVYELYDAQATREAILQSITQVIEQVQQGTDVLIFYSGHGEYNDALGRGYWIPVEASQESEFLPNSELHDYIKALDRQGAGHVLVIADSCFSGSFVGATRNTRAVAVRQRDSIQGAGAQRYLQRLHADSARQALTSGGIHPVSDGGGDGHSIFTRFLLKHLQNPMYPVFTATELSTWVQRNVGDNSDQVPHLGVIKYAGHEGGEFVFARKNAGE